MIIFLQKKRKAISVFLTVLMFSEIIYPSVAHALTSGPSQPEVQSFQPVGMTDMVDLFSGDFSYNIPLFELPGPNGGYPFNLAYSSGIGMDQEASWVGLGWNLNAGTINRQMRGLPDEFKGDEIKTKMAIDPSVTVGLGAGASVEIFGGAGLTLGFSVYQNNYKGFGYSLDGSLGFEKTTKGITSSLGIGFSLDAKEGVGITPSLGLGNKIGEFGLGVGYNSKQGLSNVSFNSSIKQDNSVKYKGEDQKWDSEIQSSGIISLSHTGYTPQITMPMKNINLNVTFKAGGSWWGIFGAPYISGFYAEQWLDRDNKNVTANGYGYLNYQYADSKSLLDFNREKDGMVSKESPNLAIPTLTYDIYSVTGQGMSMMYRPMRNDYGIVYDAKTESVSNAVGVGVDVSPASSHVGVNLSVNHSKSVSGKWTGSTNSVQERAEFQKKSKNNLYEPWYFKVHGEPTSENVTTLSKVGGDKAVRVSLTGLNDNAAASALLENKSGSVPVPSNSAINQERKPRNHSIIPITNGELLTSTNEEMISLFKVKYINNADTKVDYNRSTPPKHHFAGLSALTQEGLRYIYAIPAYNNYQEEVMFSARKTGTESRVSATNNGSGDPEYKVTGTDKMLKKTQLPPYAHSYLLTSIVGPDYVDITDDGVTEDDLGYWVKFTYKKTTTDAAPFKWRDPYTMAHYQEGWRSDPGDDKGSYVYGEKEMWYLAEAETKSHIAIFEIEAREDGRGVSDKFQMHTSAKGAPVYALKSIKLYTRLGGPLKPVKTTRFEYDYALCPGVENSTTNKGKLTLKKLWFEYGTTVRGKFNPYTFSYNNELVSNALPYDIKAYDRWGNYKPYPSGSPLYNNDFPYVDQDPAKKDLIDSYAGAWSLKEIGLPSGGKVIVDYETDDYAYVQNKTAMQMFSIVDPGVSGAEENDFTLDKNNLKVRFKLEQPIPVTGTDAQKEILKYIDTKTWQLYFKLLVELRSDSEDVQEYITGYADINQNAATMGLEQEGSTGDYIYGYFHVKPEEGHHPFSMRAWQHLRINQPDLANSGRKLDATKDQGKRINQIKSLAGLGAQIRQMFEGFYNYCNSKNWGKTVIADKSWIRLNSPDKIKYGGGLRVKQVTFKDQWSEDDEGIYGQFYDYTIEENDETISSGVAAYEPVIGGDENALRYAKKYVQSIPLRSDNNLFFEYPANESHYPGPQVGYSKVTVMSLPAAAMAGKTLLNVTLPDNKSLFPDNASFGTSGKTTHEFYTARDFPVITDETDKANKQYKLLVPVPLLGSIAVTKLTTSQGYSIITNDMHGKQRKVSNYRQAKTGEFESEPMSWVKYNYLSEERIYNKEKVSVLQNTLKDNGDGTLSINSSTGETGAKYHLGQEVDFFYDMREFEDKAWGGGAGINTDIVYIPILIGVIPIPIPTSWPNVSKSTTHLRSSVTNKVIFRSGILESVEASDGASLVKTNNLKWDKLTGQVILTSVNNNFDQPVFTYSRLAYLEYQGMGAAYQNVGLEFTISSVQKDPYRHELYQFYTPLPDGTLHPGDEILLYAHDGDFETPVAYVVYTGNIEDEDIVYTDVPLTSDLYKCRIVRSGLRNQLQVTAGTITALQDPSVKGTEVIYTKTITVPK